MCFLSFALPSTLTTAAPLASQHDHDKQREAERQAKAAERQAKRAAKREAEKKAGELRMRKVRTTKAPVK